MICSEALYMKLEKQINTIDTEQTCFKLILDWFRSSDLSWDILLLRSFKQLVPFYKLPYFCCKVVRLIWVQWSSRDADGQWIFKTAQQHALTYLYTIVAILNLILSSIGSCGAILVLVLCPIRHSILKSYTLLYFDKSLADAFSFWKDHAERLCNSQDDSLTKSEKLF